MKLIKLKSSFASLVVFEDKKEGEPDISDKDSYQAVIPMGEYIIVFDRMQYSNFSDRITYLYRNKIKTGLIGIVDRKILEETSLTCG